MSPYDSDEKNEFIRLGKYAPISSNEHFDGSFSKFYETPISYSYHQELPAQQKFSYAPERNMAAQNSRYNPERYNNYFESSSHYTQVEFSNRKGIQPTMARKNYPIFPNSRVGPKSPHQYHGITEELFTASLFFGGYVQKDSLIGGSAWFLADELGNNISNGADPVHQTFPSLIRLEYEALLNGLKAAFLKHVKILRIKGSSKMVIAHLTSNGQFPYFKSVYHFVEDLNAAIMKLLPQFFSVEFELIPPERNNFTRKLAENIIVNYHKRRDTKFQRNTEANAAAAKEQVITTKTSPSTKSVISDLQFLANHATMFSMRDSLTSESLKSGTTQPEQSLSTTRSPSPFSLAPVDTSRHFAPLVNNVRVNPPVQMYSQHYHC